MFLLVLKINLYSVTVSTKLNQKVFQGLSLVTNKYVQAVLMLCLKLL